MIKHIDFSVGPISIQLTKDPAQEPLPCVSAKHKEGRSMKWSDGSVLRCVGDCL